MNLDPALIGAGLAAILVLASGAMLIARNHWNGGTNERPDWADDPDQYTVRKTGEVLGRTTSGEIRVRRPVPSIPPDPPLRLDIVWPTDPWAGFEPPPPPPDPDGRPTVGWFPTGSVWLRDPTPAADQAQLVPVTTITVDGPPPIPSPMEDPMARSVLDALSAGPATSGALAELTGVPQYLVIRRLQALIIDHGMVTITDPGGDAAVYALNDSKETKRMGSLIILTTTETDSVSSATRKYAGPGGSQPHVVLDPGSGEAITLNAWELDLPGRDVQLPDQGLPLDAIYWVDIVGFANRLPDPESDWWDHLATGIRAIATELDVRLYFPRSFEPFAGANGPHDQRLADDEWAETVGIIGLQHVPRGHHGEPGDLTALVERLTDGSAEDTPLVGIQRKLRAAGLYDGPVGGTETTEATLELEAAVAEALNQFGKFRDLAGAQRSEIHGLVSRAQSDDERAQQARGGLEQLLDALLGPEMGPRALADIDDVLEPPDSPTREELGERYETMLRSVADQAAIPRELVEGTWSHDAPPVITGRAGEQAAALDELVDQSKDLGLYDEPPEDPVAVPPSIIDDDSDEGLRIDDVLD